MKTGRPSFDPTKNSTLTEQARECKPPRGLTRAEKARWRALVNSNPHLAAEEFSFPLEQMIRSQTRINEWQELLDRQGPTAIGSNGNVIKNPIAPLLLQEKRLIATFLNVLGISATTKSRHIPKGEQLDPAYKNPKPGSKKRGGNVIDLLA